ncbi:MAG TPA: hypothetical protein VIV40_07920 [Kofleriaceae bacterium]
MKVLVLLALLGCHASSSPAPSRVLHVPQDVGVLVSDGAAFARFAREVRAALAGTTNPDERFVLAMLDALDERWPAAVATLDQLAAADPNPTSRVMRGLTIRVWAAAATTSFRAALEAQLDAMPVQQLTGPLGELRAMATVFTPAVCRQLVTESVGPHVHDGSVPREDAHTIVFQRYAVVRLVPVAKDIDEVLAARHIELPPE